MSKKARNKPGFFLLDFDALSLVANQVLSIEIFRLTVGMVVF